jgi:hypothetical protein
MTQSFHRRLIGYSPTDVAQTFEDLNDAHAEKIQQLQSEVAVIRAQTAAAVDHLTALEEGRLKAAMHHINTLMVRAVEHMHQGTATVRTVSDRTARIEAELDGEIMRLTGILAQIYGVQHSFGSDMDHLMQRYRDTVVSLGQTFPGKPEAGPAPVGPLRQQLGAHPGVKESFGR